MAKMQPSQVQLGNAIQSSYGPRIKNEFGLATVGKMTGYLQERA